MMRDPFGIAQDFARPRLGTMSETTTDPTREQATSISDTSQTDSPSATAAIDPIAAGRLGALRRAAQHVPTAPVVVAAAALAAACVTPYSSYSSYSSYSKYCAGTCQNHTVYGTQYCNYSDYHDAYGC
jgi:hypothetical protein